MSEHITLYAAKVCPFAHRTELALAEVGAKFTRYDIDLANKPSWYASKISAESKVPVLAFGGPAVPADQPSPESTKITESLIIVEFIADLFPNAPLNPATPLERAKARFFIDTFSTKFFPAYSGFLLKGEPKEGLLDGIQALQSLIVENDKNFAVSDSFTIADVAVLSFFARMELVLKHDIGAFLEGEGPEIWEMLNTNPKYAVFKSYFERLKARESFKTTFHPEYVLGIMKTRLGSLREKKQNL